MLVEFPSVVNAVECATEIQRDMPVRNANVAEDRRIEFRIGINLGDVIVDDDDMFGDGVNVAARLESVAKPGGIAVSQSVRDNVGNRLDLVFEDMRRPAAQEYRMPGPRLQCPFRRYARASEERGAGRSRGCRQAVDRGAALQQYERRSGAGIFFGRDHRGHHHRSVSKISGLFVVGRNTSFAYKGKSPQLQTVATELGVKFLLEGSVRKAGQRVRVTGQLIDGSTGGHLWADRYDRDLTDIFAIQDEITKSIVEQLKIRLLPDGKEGDRAGADGQCRGL